MPLRGESKEDTSSLANLWFLSFREERNLGRGLSRPALGLSAKSNFRWCGHEKERCSFSEHSSKPFAGFRSPRPRFLSSRKERNQRFAKEEVSSLDSSPRGFSPRELRKAKFSPPDCSASRRISSIAPATSGSRVPSSSALTSNMQSGFQKGLAPFVGGVGTKWS